MAGDPERAISTLPLCIGLVLHPRRDPGAAAEEVVALARRHGLSVLVRAADVDRCPDGVAGVTEDELAERADILISLGGDGTMLGALRLVVHRPVPVLGVNLGNLGFLVEVQPEELTDAIERMEREEFSIEHHGALLCEVGGRESVAFNDIAIVRAPGEGVVHAELAVGGRRMGHVRGDGVVLATPGGSTAYAYAAGGPVVSPALEALVVTAIAPMTGISRPMVISASEPLRLTLTPDSGRPALEADGLLVGRLEPGTAIDVRLEPGAGQVVRLDADRHLRRNQVRLSLLDLPFLPDELRELLPPGA